MFEKVLENVILNYFGTYIKGIDPKNLHLGNQFIQGVWKGQVIIENVELNPDILEFIDFPLELIYSSIGQLKINVPWTKLGSQPVEVFIEDFFLILSANDFDKFNLSGERLAKSKFQILQNFSQQLLSKLSNEKNLIKQKGYTDDLVLKILDNIQLTIKNIHLRYEDKINNEAFSCGITLDELKIITTDENWKQCFIDRTAQINKNIPINKLLQIYHLIVYLTDQESHQNLIQNKQFINDKMRDFIHKIQQQKKNILLKLSVDIHLKQNPENDFKFPKIQLSFDLNIIDLNFNENQIEIFSQLLEKYINFNLKIIKTRKKKIQEDQQILNNYEKRFIQQFQQLLKEQKNTLNSISQKEKDELTTILEEVSIIQLQQWIKLSVKEFQTSQLIKQQEENKKKQASSWSNWVKQVFSIVELIQIRTQNQHKKNKNKLNTSSIKIYKKKQIKRNQFKDLTIFLISSYKQKLAKVKNLLSFIVI